MDYESDIKAELTRIGSENRARLDSIQREAKESARYVDAVRAEVLALVDRRVGDVAAKAEEHADRVLTVLNRRNYGELTGAAPLETPEMKTFVRYLRLGQNAVSPDEVKAGVLHVSTDSAGGYLAPKGFVVEVLRTAREANPIRRLSRNLNTGAGSVEFPRQLSPTQAFWTGELEARQGADLTFGSAEIPLHELACYVDVSLRLLDDAALSIEQLLAVDLGEAFTAAEGTAFLTGDGVKKPLGILNNATTGLKVVNSGNASALTPDSLIAALYSVGATNSAAGSWLMSTTTAAAVRQMKDSVGRYMWEAGNSGIVTGQPETLLGRPVLVHDDMPAVAANSFPILFGNFGRACWVLNRPDVGLAILRDDFTIRGSGCVRFHARMRTGFGTVRGDALVKVRVST